MTQPSINTTFDTSLVDLNPSISFSTTESDTSDGMSTGTSTGMSTKPVNTPQAVHVGTQQAYDQWASVYDSDGNMLQAIDDDELNTLLPSVLDQVAASSISVLDLGCGTGRNTARLLSHAWPSTSVAVTGLDFSTGMLSLARTKLAALPSSATLRLEHCDPFADDFSPSTVPLPPQNLVISTLVLEHIPLPVFFRSLAALLAPRGTALVTNMHADMGRRSQAGFVNAEGVKVRGTSYVYSLPETVQAAQGAGLELLQARERAVEAADVERGVVGARGAKWVGCKVWFGIVLRRV